MGLGEGLKISLHKKIRFFEKILKFERNYFGRDCNARIGIRREEEEEEEEDGKRRRRRRKKKN